MNSFEDAPFAPRPWIGIVILKKCLRGTLLILLGGIIAALLFQVLGRFDLAMFRVKNIVIKTSHPLTEETIRAVLPELAGKNLLAVDGKQIVEKVVGLAWVNEVTVKKIYPEELLVTVSTKKPVAVSLLKNVASFLDERGQFIAPVESVPQSPWDLPYLNIKANDSSWTLQDGVRILGAVSDTLGNSFPISQLVLDEYPYFHFYMEFPRIEVMAHHENWQSQLSRLKALLPRLAAPSNQTRRINLVFSKKAIVSPPLSN